MSDVRPTVVIGLGNPLMGDDGMGLAALAQLRKSGFVRAADRVIVFNTGTGLKYR